MARPNRSYSLAPYPTAFWQSAIPANQYNDGTTPQVAEPLAIDFTMFFETSVQSIIGAIANIFPLFFSALRYISTKSDQDSAHSNTTKLHGFVPLSISQCTEIARARRTALVHALKPEALHKLQTEEQVSEGEFFRVLAEG